MKNAFGLLTALLLAATSAGAQTSPTPAALAASHAQRLAREIGLSSDQQAKVQQILLASRQEMTAASQQAQASGDHEGLRAAMQAARTKADTQLRTVLTPAQFAKYQQIVAARIGQLHTTGTVGSR